VQHPVDVETVRWGAAAPVQGAGRHTVGGAVEAVEVVEDLGWHPGWPEDRRLGQGLPEIRVRVSIRVKVRVVMAFVFHFKEVCFFMYTTTNRLG